MTRGIRAAEDLPAIGEGRTLHCSAKSSPVGWVCSALFAALGALVIAVRRWHASAGRRQAAWPVPYGIGAPDGLRRVRTGWRTAPPPRTLAVAHRAAACVRRRQGRRMELGTMAGLSLAALILLAVAAVVVAAAVSRRRFATAAPRRQAEWPIRTDLGPVVAEIQPHSDRITVHDNGFSSTDDTGVTYTARWCDVLDLWSVEKGSDTIFTITVEHRTDAIPGFGPTETLRPLLDRIRAELATRRPLTAHPVPSLARDPSLDRAR